MNPKSILKKLWFAAFIILLGCSESETGPAGLVSLVKITSEAAGANCAAGGFKIETGVDKNGNSVLDAGEVQNSAFICNGANGATGINGTNGSNGLTSLIKVTAEAPGANCPNGGYRIDAGIDDNGNNTLEASEIDHTIYICHGSGGELQNYGKQTIALAGFITDEEAAQIIARDLGTATQEVLIVNTTQLTAVDLSKLENAINIRIKSNAALKTVTLNGFESVIGRGFIIDNNPELENLNLNALQYLYLGADGNDYTQGSLYIEGAEKLTQFSFPELKIGNVKIYSSISLISAPKWVKGRLTASQNSLLTSLSLPELVEGIVEVGGENLAGVLLPKFTKGHLSINGSFTSLSLPEFTGGIYEYIYDGYIDEGMSAIVSSSPNLTSLSLPKYSKGSFSIENSALTSLTLPELAEGGIEFNNNPNLTTINLPKLKNLYSLQINNSPELATLTLPTLTAFGYWGYGLLQIQGSKLSSAGVNAILANLVQITPAITNDNIMLQMNPAAPPTGQGLTNKQTLIDNGNSVVTD